MIYYLHRNNFITVTVLTNDGPEPEENFTITLTAATKGVAIDEDGQTALLTVRHKYKRKHGNSKYIYL